MIVTSHYHKKQKFIFPQKEKKKNTILSCASQKKKKRRGKKHVKNKNGFLILKNLKMGEWHSNLQNRRKTSITLSPSTPPFLFLARGKRSCWFQKIKMGSGSSRLGSRSSRSNRTKRLFASIFICGASPSSRRSVLEVKKQQPHLVVLFGNVM